MLFASAVALGMMGLVLSSGPAVFALLDWTAFGRDQFELSVYCASSEVRDSTTITWTRIIGVVDAYHGDYSCSHGDP